MLLYMATFYSFLWLSTLATSCKELTHWKGLWCWEGLGAGGEGNDRGWDDWMASPTWWTWVWVNSGSWWWRGRPGVLRFMGLQRVGHDWATDLIWSDLICCLQETHFRPQDTYRLKVRGWKNIFHANGKQKKAGVAILISDKIDLKIKKIIRAKEGTT